MNNYRALKTELEFAREVSKYYSPEFETYYRQYCSKNDIDIDKLNREHAAKVVDSRGIEPLSALVLV